MSIFFSHTFSFADVDPMIHSDLQHICDVVLKVVLVAYHVDPHEAPMMQSMMDCYIVIGGHEDEDDLHNINIPESKWIQDIMAPKMDIDKFNQPLKIQKVNIGTEEEPKFMNIGDYWDEETMAKITNLLHEFQYLFPMKFSEMNGILGYLREMKIPLKPDAKLVKQRLYHLNP